MDYALLKKDIDVLTNAQNPDMLAVDSTTGLTAKERLMVQRTWMELMKLGRSAVGVALFMEYFTKYPQYVKHFKAFRDIDLDVLRTHPRLKAHGTTVVNALDVVIDSLEDTDTVVALLEKIGRDHDRRGLSTPAFADFQSILMMLFEMFLKDSWTLAVQEAWRKALTVVMSTVLSSMNAAEQARTAKLPSGEQVAT